MTRVSNALLILALGWPLTGVSAAPILDQSFVPSVIHADESDRFKGQTFTVGVAGQLTSFEVLIKNPLGFDTGAFRVELRRTAGPASSRVPDNSAAALLASFTPSFSDVPSAYSFLPFALSSPVAVGVGDILAITIAHDADRQLPWAAQFGSPYAGGRGVYSTDPPGDPDPFWVFMTLGIDLGFQTYVDPVPEPSSMLLIGTGLGGLLFRRWRAHG